MPVRSLIEIAAIRSANKTDSDLENVRIAAGELCEVFIDKWGNSRVPPLGEHENCPIFTNSG